MICEEFGGKDLSPATCAATKRNGWCDRTCETPQNNPIAIDQDSQISTTTPELVPNTVEPTKTIVGHSVKAKAEIMGKCVKRNESLTWGACLQRKRNRHPITCRDCDQSPFIFSEPPKGRGWANSAARVGERECPELDGRKLKKSTCLMRAGKKRKAGQSCNVTCQYWKGEKKVEKQEAIYICAECHSNKVAVPNMICKKCFDAARWDKPMAIGNPENTRHKPLVAMWCPICQEERMGVPGGRCGECADELLPIGKPDCAHKVEEANINPANPNHVHLIGISEKLMSKITAHERGMQEIRKMTESIQSLAAEILDELQKAVKEVEGAL